MSAQLPWSGMQPCTDTALVPGLRHVVEPHGGHFWSTQGQIRPLDITSLRIDQQERMTLQLASTLISPTHYMTAYLRQRGWKLPKDRYIPTQAVWPECMAAQCCQARAGASWSGSGLVLSFCGRAGREGVSVQWSAA